MPRKEELQVEHCLFCQRNDANIWFYPTSLFFLSTSEFLPSALVQYLLSDKESCAWTHSFWVVVQEYFWYIVSDLLLQSFFGTKFDLPYNIRFKPLQGQRWIPPTQIFKTAHQLPCEKKILLSFRATSCEMTMVKVGIVAWQQVKADSFLSADVHLGGLPCVGS